jgi:GT2 family glycosyltransferase
VPVYDDVHGHKGLLSDYRGPASDYLPKPVVHKLRYSDACAFMITRSAWLALGGFDERAFGKFAWGADVDLCLRARVAGFGVYATELAYINHFGRQTANAVSRIYGARAQFRYRYGMLRYWRKDWRLLTTRPRTIHLPTAPPEPVAGSDPSLGIKHQS